MKVVVCIPTRGRSESLKKVVDILIAGCSLPDTEIVVAIDADDDSYGNPSFEHGNRVVWSQAEREDTLGAKYNRAVRATQADVYVLWADDMVMPDPGWDAKISLSAAAFPDRCGVVLYGKIEGVLQPGIAVTRKFIDAMGFFAAPYFPYWWVDTWIMEVATMAGRYIHTDVNVSLLGEMKQASRGVRDILFWAELFDKLRPRRIAVAESIIRAGLDSPLCKYRLLSEVNQIAETWRQSNSILRDPARADALQQHYSFDAPEDERYLRVKAQAEAMNV